MSELERWRQNKLDRQTARDIAELHRGEVTAKAQTEVRENLAAYEVGLRISNGHRLTRLAQNAATAQNMTSANDNSDLAVNHRILQRGFAVGASNLINDYMDRPRRCE